MFTTLIYIKQAWPHSLYSTVLYRRCSPSSASTESSSQPHPAISPRMRAQSILAFALLQLQTCKAAPTYPTAALEHSKRCMTQAEVAAFQASRPADSGISFELDICDEHNTPERSLLSRSGIEDLVRRYLFVGQMTRRATDIEKGKRCMTDDEIKNMQDKWPVGGGKGPAMIPCSQPPG